MHRTGKQCRHEVAAPTLDLAVPRGSRCSIATRQSVVSHSGTPGMTHARPKHHQPLVASMTASAATGPQALVAPRTASPTVGPNAQGRYIVTMNNQKSRIPYCVWNMLAKCAARTGEADINALHQPQQQRKSYGNNCTRAKAPHGTAPGRTWMGAVEWARCGGAVPKNQNMWV